MPALAPLKLTLYDPETQEARGDYICNHVPMRYLKLGIRLFKSKVNINMDILAGLIVDLFGRQFSVGELRKYSDPQDQIILLQALVGRPKFLLMKEEDEKDGKAPKEDNPSDLEEEIVELEILLTDILGWNLYAIDETDIESLFPFVKRFIGSKQKISQKEPVRLKAEQVKWF